MRLASRVLIGLGLAALPAFCGPIGFNNTNEWYGLAWNTGVSNNLIGNSASSTGDSGVSTILSLTAGPWTFTTPANFVTRLTFQDLYSPGDRFQVFDTSVLTFTTSIPVDNTAENCANNPIACSLNSDWSKGTHDFATGAHSITMQIIQSASNTTTGFAVFRIENIAAPAIPEPTTLGLMGLGLGGLLLRWRAKRS
jgi:hypothetical protein